MLRSSTAFSLLLGAFSLGIQAPSAAPVANAAAAAPAQAERPDPLAALVREAIRENLGLEEQRLAERRTAAELREARGYYFPSLSLESRHSRMGGVRNLGDLVNPAYRALNELSGTTRFPTGLDITMLQRNESHLRLTQPLWNQSIRAGHDAARANHDAQGEAYDGAARQLAANVQIAYLQQAMARRVEEIYESTSALVEENERVAERLLAAGRATPDALLRARAERADVEQDRAEATEARIARTRELNLLLHRPPDTPVEIMPDQAFDLPLDIDADAAVAHALAAREELRAADDGRRASRALQRAAMAGSLPSVSLAVDYALQGPEFSPASGDDYWVASVVLSWSVFEGGRQAARRAAARYDVDRAAVHRRELEERITVEVRNAYQAALVKRAAIVSADARLQAARSAFELVRRRYQEGIASPVEFVEARTAYTKAELNRAITSYEYAVRRVDLERAAALRDIDG
jgi:outer membrane protein TolC